MSTRRTLLRTSTVAASPAIALAIGLFAAPATTAQAQLAEQNLLEEVVVTARKREESLMDVPVAVSVLTTDFVQAANIMDTYDLYAETPGVDYEETRERLGGRTTIRGVNPGSQNPVNQKVSIFIDGAPIFGTNVSMQYIDLERVEVLRGPQSAAFGRATFAGAVNYVTRDPGDEFGATFKLTGSDLGRTIIGASLDGPITDTLGFTADIVAEEFDAPDEWVTSDGFRSGSTSTDYFAGKLKYTPNDFFDMELTASYLEADDGPGSEWLVNTANWRDCNNVVLGNGRPYLQGDFDCQKYQPDAPNPRNHDLTTEYVPGTDDWNEAWAETVQEPGAVQERTRFAGEFNFNFDNGGLLQAVISTAEDDTRRWIDADMSDVSTVNMGGFSSMNTNNMGNRRGTDKEDFIDVRWLSPDDSSLRWMVGVSRFEFGYSDAAINEFNAIENPDLGLECLINNCMPFDPTRRQNQSTEATGVYGNVNWDVSDRTTLSFEGRFQRDENLTRDVVSGASVTQVTDSFQPRFAINHSLNDSWSLYGQISQGTSPAVTTPEMINPTVQAASEAAMASGFINYTTATFASSDEETLTNFEFGIKGNAMDGRLQLAASIYYIDWEDMLLNETFRFGGNDPVNGSCAGVADCWNDGSWDPNGVIYDEDFTDINGVRVNSGTGELSGVELEANFRATDRWSFRTMLALQNNEYGTNCDLSGADQGNNGFGFASDCIVRGVPGLQVAGNEIERNADTQFTLSTSYVAPLGIGDNWEWTARLGIRYVGDKYYDVINYAVLPATTTTTGQISFQNDNWQIILFGNNLTNEDTPLDFDDFRDRRPGGTGGANHSWRYRPRLPREVGARLNYTF
ncbi:MAG: TonB-dependent receptor [Candidatus Rariloculaceae bacterium]